MGDAASRQGEAAGPDTHSRSVRRRWRRPVSGLAERFDGQGECSNIEAETLAFPRRGAVAADAHESIDLRVSRSAYRCGGSAGMAVSVKTQRTCFPFNPQATEWHAGHLRTVCGGVVKSN